MKLFGYVLDSGVLSERVSMGPLDAPVAHRGNDTGCLVLHGIGGTPANVRPLSDALMAAGYSVSAPLLAGHGGRMADFAASTGEEWLETAQEAFDGLLAMGCDRVAVIGLSLGGILAGLLAQERDVAAAVLICPPAVMKGYLHFARRMSGLLPYVRYDGGKDETRRPQYGGYENMLSGMATRKLRDLERLCRTFRRDLPRITCPVLSVQAKYDNKVDPRTYALLRERAVNAASFEHIVMEHSAHGCTYGSERAYLAEQVVDYLKRTL